MPKGSRMWVRAGRATKPVLSELDLKGQGPKWQSQARWAEFWALGEMQVGAQGLPFLAGYVPGTVQTHASYLRDEGAGTSWPISRIRKLRGERLWSCKWRAWVPCPVLEDWAVIGCERSLGPARASKGGGEVLECVCTMLGHGRPQEATVMILGRAEKFLSQGDGIGKGGEGEGPEDRHTPSRSLATPPALPAAS